MARAELDKQPGDVAAMFDSIAGRYDLLNDILSAGQGARRRGGMRGNRALAGQRRLGRCHSWPRTCWARKAKTVSYQIRAWPGVRIQWFSSGK